MNVTLVGFGSRTAPKVLDLLVKLQEHDLLLPTIQLIHSPQLKLQLLRPPHRLWSSNNDNDKNNDKDEGNETEQTNIHLIIYCVPTTAVDYTSKNGISDSSLIRSTILSSSIMEGNHHHHQSSRKNWVLSYNPTTDQFLSNNNEDLLNDTIIITALQNKDSSLALRLSLATMSALSKLDEQASNLMQSVQTSSGDVVLVIGSGGREHALAVALSSSPSISKVICCPGNGGTAMEPYRNKGQSKIINASHVKDNNAIVQFLNETTERVTMVVVGPEAPLVDGLVDLLAKECPHVMAFGPTKDAAMLEASKAFTKDFLQEHEIPTAKYRNFTNSADAIAYVESLDESDRQVVKASGLAAGKGVLLPTTKAETIAAIHEIMSDRAFGNAGDTCVIESFLTGPEASCLAFCDGKTAKLLPAAQDHKRALDGDCGLNTGGMGAYAPAPCVTPKLHDVIEKMCVKTVEKMAERGTPYVGILYAGMILTPNGPMVLEFNCRFGDPETQVLLPLLQSDLYQIFKACCTGTLHTIDLQCKPNTSAATVVCAAKGYPSKYPKGMVIHGIDDANALSNHIKVYEAGTKVDDDDDENNKSRCSGGRVLAVTGIGSTLQQALDESYRGVSNITFVDEDTTGNSNLLHYRRDIGKRAVEQKLRLGILGSTRGTALLPIMEACSSSSSGNLHAEIVAVLSNKRTAPILEKGSSLGSTVSTEFVSAKGLSREEYDAECTSILLDAGVEFVLLVGYMRILSKSFTDQWSGRCLNVHPSLLPKHAGGMDLAVHQAVLDAGETETGCTIHQVTETVDGGPIVIQKVVSVEANDTAESLKAKVQAQEGKAFVEAIDLYIRETRKNIPTTIEAAATTTYADAGVSIDAGNNLVELIKPMVKRTRRPGCDSVNLGGFGGLFDLSAAGYVTNDTMLIGATDGVGTKLRIAQATKNHSTIGIDLVAMCVNDLIVVGGEPLFFLDYYATGHLDVSNAAEVVRGIAEGCVQAGCGLIGGETAEMPSMYASEDYDVAGFAVGAVPQNEILPKDVTMGDILLGLPSTGIHSNGFSLVRKLIEKANIEYGSPCPWNDDDESMIMTVGESLLTPTKIYVKSCLPLVRKHLIKGMAHITGGGLLENIPRSIPKGMNAEITSLPPLPGVFRWLKQESGLDDVEMLRTFNCGIGMVLIVHPSDVAEAKDLLLASGEVDAVIDLGVLVDAGGGGEKEGKVIVKEPLQ